MPQCVMYRGLQGDVDVYVKIFRSGEAITHHRGTRQPAAASTSARTTYAVRDATASANANGNSAIAIANAIANADSDAESDVDSDAAQAAVAVAMKTAVNTALNASLSTVGQHSFRGSVSANPSPRSSRPSPSPRGSVRFLTPTRARAPGSPPGPATARFSPAPTQRAMVVVTVEDHGAGVSEQMSHTLFKLPPRGQRAGMYFPSPYAPCILYHTSKYMLPLSEHICPASAPPGSGMGLFTLRKRVEALGGDFGVNTRPDGEGGASFWFSFPYRPDVKAAAAATVALGAFSGERTGTAGTRPEPAAPAAPGGGGLCVDGGEGSDRSSCAPSTTPGDTSPAMPLQVVLAVDESLKATTVGHVIRSHGHTVTLAVNGGQCLVNLIAAYNERRVDCIVADLQMPVLDGLYLVLRFRAFEGQQHKERAFWQHKPWRRVLVVVTSASDDPSTRKAALDAGADYFLPKVTHALVGYIPMASLLCCEASPHHMPPHLSPVFASPSPSRLRSRSTWTISRRVPPRTGTRRTASSAAARSAACGREAVKGQHTHRDA